MPASTMPSGRRVIVTGAAGGIGPRHLDEDLIVGDAEARAVDPSPTVQEQLNHADRCLLSDGITPGRVGVKRILGP